MKKILAFDSGAKRMGWASIWKSDPGLFQIVKPIYHMSGILSLEREGQKFQDYRVELVEELSVSIPALIELTQPDEIVNEIIPAVGGGNFVAATQSYLANTAITVVQTIAAIQGINFWQIGATTVQSQIAIGRKRGQKVSKVMVRNGVIKLLPELAPRKKQWVKTFDECDAIAIGLTAIGFNNKEIS